MVGKLCKAITVGLGAALACSVTAPAWSSDCDTSYGDDDPLGVLSNFEDCVFHDQSSPVDDGLKPLDHLEQLSPGKWKSFARYNFQSDSYTYAKSGIDGVLDVTGNRRGGTFSFTDLGKLAPYSEFAVSLIRNRDNNQDLTDNDYVFYTFDIEDWKTQGSLATGVLHSSVVTITISSEEQLTLRSLLSEHPMILVLSQYLNRCLCWG
jgi:hypothetical protein